MTNNTPYSGTTGPERCAAGPNVALRSLADVGLLPAGLSSLRYDPADPDARRWGNRGLDFRLVIRLINTNTHTGPDASVRLQVQGLIVARNALGVFMSLELASRAARFTQLPQVGLISSAERLSGTVDARTFITGVGGGWRFQMCRVGSPGAVPASISSIWTSAVPGCTPGSFPAAGELPIYLSASGHQDALTAAIFEVSSGRSADPTGRMSADSPPGGRLAALVTHTPHDQFHQVLHSDDVGIPRLNRMRTHLDMGGFTVPNTGAIAGTDRDGDGAIDSRLHLIGDTRTLVDTDGDGDPLNDPEDPADQEHRPIIFHGMAHFTGGVQIGGRRLDQRLRSGDLYVAGASVIGGTDDGCDPVPDGIDPATMPCNVIVDGASINRRDNDTALVAFPASRGSHANPVPNEELEPGDQRVRGHSEFIARAFAAHGIEIIGGRFVVASAPSATSRFYTRPTLLHSLSQSFKLGVDSTTAPATAGATDVDGVGEGRGEDGFAYISPLNSVHIGAEESVLIAPERSVLIQPSEANWRGTEIPGSGGSARTSPFIHAYNSAGKYAILDPDAVYLSGGNRGTSADATDTAFASVRTTAPFGPPTGVFASRVLSASLPDYHLVNWHLSGDGGTGPFDAAYGCPPGMQLVGPGIGPQQHVIPTGWRKERAPTAIEDSVLPAFPLPADAHGGLWNATHPAQTYNINWPITGTLFSVVGSFTVGFPTHPTPHAHPAQQLFFNNPGVPPDLVTGRRDYIRVNHHDSLLGWRINPQDGSDAFDGSEAGYQPVARNAVDPLILDAPVPIDGHSSFLALYHCTFLR